MLEPLREDRARITIDPLRRLPAHERAECRSQRPGPRDRIVLDEERAR
jgi:hypothetical protein